MNRTKVVMDEKDLPRRWYNLAADLPTPPLPPLGPDGKPVKPEMLRPVFPDNLIEQEVSTKRWIKIPQEILEILALWRPSPLYRAYRLEQALGTPARIYYKHEGVSPPGSHKPNTAVPQAWYNKQFGIKRLATETGAGQWGSALAFACSLTRSHWWATRHMREPAVRRRPGRGVPQTRAAKGGRRQTSNTSPPTGPRPRRKTRPTASPPDR